MKSGSGEAGVDRGVGEPGIHPGEVGGPGDGMKRSGTKDSFVWKRSGVNSLSLWM